MGLRCGEVPGDHSNLLSLNSLLSVFWLTGYNVVWSMGMGQSPRLYAINVPGDYHDLVDVTKQPTCMKGACCTNTQ